MGCREVERLGLERHQRESKITCNYYYESPEDSNYLYGKIQNVITENETGVYEGEIVHIKLEGKQDGTREIHVTY